MKTAKSTLVLINIFVMILLSCQKENTSGGRNKDATGCSLNCKNGGICKNNSCSCPDGYSGADCGVYYTSTYAGDYISTNFNCGQGVQVQSTNVSVDPGNKNRILIGSVFADMTDRTHFTIPTQGANNTSGSGTIDGKTMTMTQNANVINIFVTCSGTFSKK